MVIMNGSEERSEIAFFDVETTIPSRVGQGYAILEFGSILVCPRKLIELQNYSTLIRPHDLSLISTQSVRCNGITKDDVVSAPCFADIADKVYDVLHGRIWAGHNILRFDCPRIREAFAEINRPPPEPKGTLDSLALLTQKFGRRAGNMKMASLASYFGLGQQTHRSLDDVRMNLEVLKYCATVLFLESSLPEIFPENSWVSPNSITRSRNNWKSPHQDSNSNSPSPSNMNENLLIPSTVNQVVEEDHPILKFITPSTSENSSDQSESIPTRPDPFDMGLLSDEVSREELPSDDSMDEEISGSASRESSSESISASTDGATNTFEDATSTAATQASATGSAFSGTIDIDGFFVEVDRVSLPSISVIQVPFFRGTQKILTLHNNEPLQLLCNRLKVRFGVSFSKFVDYAGRPRLTFVVNATPSLCRVLDTIDNLAQKLSTESGSNSEWRPMVIRKPGFLNSPTLRLNLLTTFEDNMICWDTELYKEGERLQYSGPDTAELESISTSGSFVDVYFSLDAYDYQQNAGIRLVAKKLIVRSN
ncbi:DNA metabolism protein [Lithospermum erythrorhizon]|uniref:DNA metabolism protein n=1 Tax=Lithospermum erythrorhizon TaxID=34254 RepID=A0AAV3NZI4_LITER